MIIAQSWDSISYIWEIQFQSPEFLSGAPNIFEHIRQRIVNFIQNIILLKSKYFDEMLEFYCKILTFYLAENWNDSWKEMFWNSRKRKEKNYFAFNLFSPSGQFQDNTSYFLIVKWKMDLFWILGSILSVSEMGLSTFPGKNNSILNAVGRTNLHF